MSAALRMPTPTPAVGVTPPDLDDPNQFACRPAVPILDTHVRKGREVSADLLRLIVANTNRACARGEFPQLLIGHTDDHGPETAQPPLVGFLRNFVMGEWQGRPCILADLCIYRSKLAEALQYPRRSAEAWYSDDPAGNQIDSCSLLRRSPERPLGLVTYARDDEPERRPCPEDSPMTMDSLPGLLRYCKANAYDTLDRYMDGVAAYKVERSKEPPAAVEVPASEVPDEARRIERYCRERGYGPDRVAEGIAAYRAEKGKD